MLAMLPALALFTLIIALFGAALAQPKGFDKKALADELRLRDEIDQELRRRHPLSPEVRVGDILTFGAVSLSAAGLLFALARDRALRRKEYADRIRHGAALIVVKADRWREISSHFFDELQPVIVDTDAKLKSESTEAIRDFWWKEVELSYACTRKAILDEEIEHAYLDLYGYNPSVQKIFLNSMRELRNIDSEIHTSFLRDTQDIIKSTPRPYFSAKLGNPLRSSCQTHRDELEQRMRMVVTALRDNLEKIVSASDKAIVKGSVSMASSLVMPIDSAPGKGRSLTMPANRWALIIGIDICPKIGRRLLGPSNDLAMFSELLQSKFGFPSNHIIRLVGADASRAEIIRALEWITSETQAGDVVLFYFSGNGSQITPDRERPDRMLATLVPYDSGREEGQNFDISETELNRYFKKIDQNRRLVIILDTCHSGGMGEHYNVLPAIHAADDSRPVSPSRGIGPPMAADLSDGDHVGTQLLSDVTYTLLTACRKSERAYEFESPAGIHFGTFSYFLATALAKAGPTTSYRQVLDEAAAEVTRLHSQQCPQIEGDADCTLGELFGT
jgi:hypothetical protein